LSFCSLFMSFSRLCSLKRREYSWQRSLSCNFRIRLRDPLSVTTWPLVISLTSSNSLMIYSIFFCVKSLLNSGFLKVFIKLSPLCICAIISSSLSLRCLKWCLRRRALAISSFIYWVLVSALILQNAVISPNRFSAYSFASLRLASLKSIYKSFSQLYSAISSKDLQVSLGQFVSINLLILFRTVRNYRLPSNCPFGSRKEKSSLFGCSKSKFICSRSWTTKIGGPYTANAAFSSCFESSGITTINWETCLMNSNWALSFTSFASPCKFITAKRSGRSGFLSTVSVSSGPAKAKSIRPRECFLSYIPSVKATSQKTRFAMGKSVLLINSDLEHRNYLPSLMKLTIGILYL